MIKSRNVAGKNNDQEVDGPSPEELSDQFDELIMACDADACVKILGKEASWLERKVLGNVKVSLYSLAGIQAINTVLN